MSEKKYILNLFGTEVDFSTIATDNVPEWDISSEILDEKLSFLMLWRNPNGLSFYNNRQTVNPCNKCEVLNSDHPGSFIPECRNGHFPVEYVEPCEKKKRGP